MKKSINLKWIINSAFLLTFVLLYENSEPISNYFDSSRFYTIYLFLPALALLCVSVLLQKSIDPGFLISVYESLQAMMMVLLGIVTLYYQSFNGDNVMYISAYIMIYNRYLYCAAIAFAPSIIYLLALKQFDIFRSRDIHMKQILLQIWQQCFLATFVAILLILIAVYYALGIYLVIGGTLSLVSALRVPMVAADKSSKKLNEDGKNPSNTFSSRNQSKLKNGLMSFLVFIFITTIGYLWPIDYVFRFSGELMYFTRVPHRTIYLNMEALFFFFIVGFILYIFKIDQKICNLIGNSKRSEMLTALITTGLALIMFGLMNLGISPFSIRISAIFTPWIIVFVLLWFNQYFIKRKLKSPGIFGIVLVLGLFCFWGGMTLGIEADEGFAPYIWFSTIIASVLIVLFLYIFLEPTLKRGKDEGKQGIKDETPAKDESRTLRESTGDLLEKFYRILHNSKIGKVAIVLIIVLIPTLSVIIPSQAPTNFQVLANVDNYCVFYLADPSTRIDKDYKPNFGLSSYQNANNTVKISAAKNEFESVQIVMLPIHQAHMSIYDISFTGFAHESDPESVVINPTEYNFSAYRVDYVDALGNIIPDILQNFSSFAISDGKNHPLWFTFYVPMNVTHGNYNGTLSFSITDRETTDTGFYMEKEISFNVQLEVYDFYIPEIPMLKSNFGFGDYAQKDLVSQWYKEHRMMEWDFVSLPPCTVDSVDGSVTNINFTEFESSIQALYEKGSYSIGFHYANQSILPLTTFTIAGTDYSRTNYTTYAPQNIVDTTYQDYFQIVEEWLKNDTRTYLDSYGNNRSWFDDFYLNAKDEIEARPIETRELYLGTYKWLKTEIGMNFPIMQTVMHPNEYWQDRILEVVDILCWHTIGAEDAFITKAKEQGKQVWIYTTRGPRFPIPSVSTSGMATQLRALGWQCFVFNYSNYLIWDVATPRNGMMGYGYQGWNGGSLLYREPNGFALSTRMELIRDGFEDYEYFYLLSESIETLKVSDPLNTSIAVGEQLLEEIDALFGPGFDPEMNYMKFQDLRHEIASLLSKISIL